MALVAPLSAANRHVNFLPVVEAGKSDERLFQGGGRPDCVAAWRHRKMMPRKDGQSPGTHTRQRQADKHVCLSVCLCVVCVRKYAVVLVTCKCKQALPPPRHLFYAGCEEVVVVGQRLEDLWQFDALQEGGEDLLVFHSIARLPSFFPSLLPLLTSSFGRDERTQFYCFFLRLSPPSLSLSLFFSPPAPPLSNQRRLLLCLSLLAALSPSPLSLSSLVFYV